MDSLPSDRYQGESLGVPLIVPMWSWLPAVDLAHEVEICNLEALGASAV